MTVSSTANRVSYNCNGSQTVFVYNFRIFQDADLKVILTDSGDNETALTLDSDYTVSGAGNESGGSITTAQTYASGNKVTILRELELKQETNYEEGGSFPAESHENALDKLTMICQQLGEAIGRAIKLPRSSAYSDLELPDPEANRALIWNSAGTALMNAVVSSVIGAFEDLTNTPSSLSGKAGIPLAPNSAETGWEFLLSALTGAGSKVLGRNSGNTAWEMKSVIELTSISALLPLRGNAGGTAIEHKQISAGRTRGTATTLVKDTWTKINLYNSTFDKNGDIDFTTNDRFTAPEDGLYFFSGAIDILSLADAKASAAAIYKNGVATEVNYLVKYSNAAHFCIPVTALLELDEGDYVELYGYHNDTVDRDIDNPTYFQVFQLLST